MPLVERCLLFPFLLAVDLDYLPEVIDQCRSMQVEGEVLPLSPHAITYGFQVALVMQKRDQLTHLREEEAQI